MQKNHFFLSNKISETRNFTPRTPKMKGREIPQRNRAEHAELLKTEYQRIVNEAITIQRELESQGLPVAKGVYLDMDINKKLISSSLDTKSGARIMKVTEKKESDNANVTLFIREQNKDWLTNKTDEYATNGSDERPKNNKLIAPINQIKESDIHSLYESAESFNELPENELLLFELWVRNGDDYSIETISQSIDTLDIKCDVEKRLQFNDVDVFLIRTTKSVLASLPNHIGNIEGIRRYHEPSILTKSHEASREWSSLLQGEIYNITNDSVRIGILDTGVNNAHRLLSPALPEDKMDSAIGVLDNIDHSEHGTGMAGLALLGDLTELAYRRGSQLNIGHSLASIKIFEKGHETESTSYGAVIEDSINKAQDMGALINCMAVTDVSSFDGQPTSSSAALDESIYHGGACDRMVIVSAGNIDLNDVDATSYLDSCRANVILSPSQAWNALTVGAYTEKTIVSNPRSTPLAAPGGVSPLSRSTYSWMNWRVKPEIVMEGGNLTSSPTLGILTDTDLSVITTSQELRAPLIAFNATSAATALASHLAAKIKVANPNLSILSVRALMVHSANWTPEMIRIGQQKEIMPLCGYGVPNEEVATFSNEKCATFIFENEIKPFTQGSSPSNNNYNEMHYYDLPWPIKLLETMHDETVTMRVTLSYYVKPAPGTGGKNNKYKYPSATLHFDVKTWLEEKDEFLRRRNKNEGESSRTNIPERWKIGQLRRENGTVQSDWFTCTAQELSECGKIAVYPSAGWWKERKLGNIDNVIKYSLVVSIKSEKTEIYQAVETAIKSRIGIEIANTI